MYILSASAAAKVQSVINVSGSFDGVLIPCQLELLFCHVHQSGHGRPDRCQWNGFLKPLPTIHVCFGIEFGAPPCGTRSVDSRCASDLGTDLEPDLLDTEVEPSQATDSADSR